jgi:hypothetical protein
MSSFLRIAAGLVCTGVLVLLTLPLRQTRDSHNA